MRRYLDLSSWIILFALLPVSLLAFLSQNAVPGELFYPVKRGLENVVLVASSVHPATKVAFRTDLTERRFAEAESLLVAQGQTTALTDFVAEFRIIEEELAQISSVEEKKELTEKLVARINEYETKLVAYKAVLQESQRVSESSGATPTTAPSQQAPSGPTASPSQPTQFSPPSTTSPKPGETFAPSTTTPTPSPAISLPTTSVETPIIAITDPVERAEAVKGLDKALTGIGEVKERNNQRLADVIVEEKIKEETKKHRENQKEDKNPLQQIFNQGESRGGENRGEKDRNEEEDNDDD